MDDGIGWLRHIRGRLTVLARRAKEIEEAIRMILGRLDRMDCQIRMTNKYMKLLLKKEFKDFT